MTLKHLQKWAQSQIDNTAKLEIRHDIGITVLQLVDEIEDLKHRVNQLEEKLNELNPGGVNIVNTKLSANTAESALAGVLDAIGKEAIAPLHGSGSLQ